MFLLVADEITLYRNPGHNSETFQKKVINLVWYSECKHKNEQNLFVRTKSLVGNTI